MQEAGRLLNDRAKSVKADLNLGFCLISSGMFKETLDSLGHIDLSGIPDSTRAEYYALMGRYYFDLGDFDKDNVYTPLYNIKASTFIDSALAIWKPGSIPGYYKGLKDLKAGTIRCQGELQEILHRTICRHTGCGHRFDAQ
jgi:hypothetical protein